MSGEPLRLTVVVGLDETDSAEARDDEARLLRRELEDAGVAEVEIAPGGGAAPGAKAGEAFDFGALAVSVAPAALTGLLALSKDWLKRRTGRTLSFSYGSGAQRIEFQYDPDKTDLNQLVAQLMQAHTAASLALGAGSRVGGDVVGGDKQTTTHTGGDSVGRDKVTHVHAAPGATVIFGSPPADQPHPEQPPAPAASD